MMLLEIVFYNTNLDTYAENGWPSWGYGISKLCINTYVTTLP